MSETARPRSRAWFMVPQVVSRLSGIAVFAVIANHTRSDVLGVFALISAVASGALAFGPAIVAKPLAAASNAAERSARARLAVSAAGTVALSVATVFAAGALVTHGLVRLTLIGAALATWGALGVEATYWALVFTRSARTAGIANSVAYGAQAVLTLACALTQSGEYLVLVPPGTLAVAAAFAVASQRPTLPAARTWWTEHRHSWLPYVGGSGASIAMVQTIPLMVTATVGLAGASVFRALELAFGPTNLAASVTTNSILARGTEQHGGPRRVFRRSALELGSIAVVNGLLLIFLPLGVIRPFVGTAAEALRHEAVIASVFRTAYAVNLAGAILLVSIYAARTVGVVNVVAVLGTLSGLLVGLLVDGMTGGFVGLASTEIAFGLVYWTLLRRGSRLAGAGHAVREQPPPTRAGGGPRPVGRYARVTRPVIPATGGRQEGSLGLNFRNMKFPRPHAPWGSRTPDAAASGARRGPRRRLRAFIRDLTLTTLVIGCAVLLGAFGYMSATKAHAQFAATSYVTMNSDGLGSQQQQPSPDQANRFVQSQIFPFTTKAFERSIGTRLKIKPTDTFTLSVEQVGVTDLVSVRAAAATGAEAVRISDTAADVMVRQVAASIAAPLILQRNSIRARLAVIAKAAVGKSSTAVPAGVTLAGRRAAANAAYQQLNDIENQIALTQPPSKQAAAVLLKSSTEGAKRAVSPTRSAGLYGLVGLVLSLALAIWIRRRSLSRVPEESPAMLAPASGAILPTHQALVPPVREQGLAPTNGGGIWDEERRVPPRRQPESPIILPRSPIVARTPIVSAAPSPPFAPSAPVFPVVDRPIVADLPVISTAPVADDLPPVSDEHAGASELDEAPAPAPVPERRRAPRPKKPRAPRPSQNGVNGETREGVNGKTRAPSSAGSHADAADVVAPEADAPAPIETPAPSPRPRTRAPRASR